jgi:selenocysteine lyase/cysteine desulfurase
MAPDFAALRNEFPSLETWSHFDIARKAPLPRCVEQSMAAYMNDIYETGGEVAFSEKEIEHARETLAQLVGVSPKTLAFIKNTSEGLNIAALGMDLEPGDKVLITEFEHSACVLPYRRLAGKGIEVEVVKARDGRVSAEAVLERVDSKTRAVAVSWVAYGNGYRIDVPALTKVCRDKGVFTVIDGIQAVGVLATPIEELGADFVVAGGHKALLSHIGSGIFYCRQDLIPKIEPAYVARFSFATDDKWQEPLVLAQDAHRFEYGNPNFLGIWVLRHSAEFIMGIGLDNIEERVKELTSYFIERADEKGLSLATPRPWEERAGILSFKVSEPETIRQKLRENKFIVNVKDGRYLRAATHFYNTEEEIDRLVQLVAEHDV